MLFNDIIDAEIGLEMVMLSTEGDLQVLVCCDDIENGYNERLTLEINGDTYMVIGSIWGVDSLQNQYGGRVGMDLLNNDFILGHIVIAPKCLAGAENLWVWGFDNHFLGWVQKEFMFREPKPNDDGIVEVEEWV